MHICVHMYASGSDSECRSLDRWHVLVWDSDPPSKEERGLRLSIVHPHTIGLLLLWILLIVAFEIACRASVN